MECDWCVDHSEQKGGEEEEESWVYGIYCSFIERGTGEHCAGWGHG